MMKTVAKERLKVLRVKADFTQSQLAKKAGLTARSISLYETSTDNLRKANYSTLEKLATALGVTVEEIQLDDKERSN